VRGDRKTEDRNIFFFNSALCVWGVEKVVS
jgi:hypothetical protein